MKYSPLLKEYTQIFKTVEQEIEDGALLLTDEMKWTEWAFGVSLDAWLHIEKMVNEYGFVNRREEISFYKIVKPQFIGMIDYFSLIYKSALLQPGNCLRRAFLQRELKNCGTLLSIYKTACLQYEQEQPVEKYFLKINNQQPLIFGLNVSHLNFSAVSYSYLLGRINAVEKYRKYLQLKVNKNTLPRKVNNSVLPER